MGSLHLSRIVANKPQLGTALQALSRTQTVWTDSLLIALLINFFSSSSLLSARRIVSIAMDWGPDHLLFTVHPSDPDEGTGKKSICLGFAPFYFCFIGIASS